MPASRDPHYLPFATVVMGSRSVAPVRMARRLGRELVHARSEFSVPHNIAIVALLAATYPLAIVGFVRTRGRPLAGLLAAVIAGQLGLVAVTFSDSEGRYLLYVFPLILVFAGCGAVSLRRGRDFDLSFRDA